MNNDLVNLLESAIGVYDHSFKVDVPYITRAIFLLLVVWFIFRFLLSAFNRGK